MSHGSRYDASYHIVMDDDHTRRSHDQPGQQPDTYQIASTASAAAWLPHSKFRDTRMMSGQGNPSST